MLAISQQLGASDSASAALVCSVWAAYVREIRWRALTAAMLGAVDGTGALASQHYRYYARQVRRFTLRRAQDFAGPLRLPEAALPRRRGGRARRAAPGSARRVPRPLRRCCRCRRGAAAVG